MKYVEDYLYEIGRKYSFEVDNFIRKSLKKEAPFAYWFLSKEVFQKNIFAKIFGLEIQESQVYGYSFREITVFIYGRKIATCQITISGKLV